MLIRPLVAFLAVVVAGAAAHAQTLEAVATPNMGAQCDDLDLKSLVTALESEAATIAKLQGSMNFAGTKVSYADYAAKTLLPLAAAAKQGQPALCKALATKFTFYRNPGVGPGKFTAYQNPVFKASRSKKGQYLYPIYKRPTDAGLAALTTDQIQKGGLNGKGLELFYFIDPTEVNVVHVEGSATLQLDDGSYAAVTSDGHNGQPYQNIGKLVAADNKIPGNQVTPLGMTRARKYFQDHPDQLWIYWAKNPHFVFFKEKKGPGGPASGKFGELTAGRSLAVDPAFVPFGAAVWFHTTKPNIVGNELKGMTPYGRVALGQDTGSGIKGAGRIDVFYGSGDYAMAASAKADGAGEIYYLLAK
jgi:membrane-bound lytic murein transglycosylase A